MNLTSDQIHALDQGEAVPVFVAGREYVLVSREVFDRAQGVFREVLDGDTLYDLIDGIMADDDASDPGLDSYQKYGEQPA